MRWIGQLGLSWHPSIQIKHDIFPRNKIRMVPRACKIFENRIRFGKMVPVLAQPVIKSFSHWLSQQWNRYRKCSAYFESWFWNWLQFPLMVRMRQNWLLVGWEGWLSWYRACLLRWMCRIQHLSKIWATYAKEWPIHSKKKVQKKYSCQW
jgi:hypothetical protein